MATHVYCQQPVRDTGLLCTREPKHKGIHAHNPKRAELPSFKRQATKAPDRLKKLPAPRIPFIRLCRKWIEGSSYRCNRELAHKVDCEYNSSRGYQLPKVRTLKPKKVIRTRASLLAEQNRLERFLKLVSGIYSQDKLSPGFVTSFVPSRSPSPFYASIVRYDLEPGTSTGTIKQVLFKAYGDTMMGAVQECITQWEEKTGVKAP